MSWLSCRQPSSAATAANALATGEIDWLEMPLPDLLPVLNGSPNVKIGRLDDYDGARNDDSPLLKSKLGYSAFIGFSWAIWHSDATVPVVEERP